MRTNPLDEYLRGIYPGPQRPQYGQRPVETVKIPFERLELRGTRLGFGDTWMFWDGVTVDCAAGTYALEAECYCYGGDARVARVFATRAGRRGTRGAFCGSFGVDAGSACIIDYDAIEGYADHDQEAFNRWMEHQVIGIEPSRSGSILCAPAKTSMVVLDSGFGDGTYAVYEQRDGHELVGAEVVFLTEGAPYPCGAER